MKHTLAILGLFAALTFACGKEAAPPPNPTPVPEPTMMPVPTAPPVVACVSTGDIGHDGMIWKGDCQVSDTCKQNIDGTFSGSCKTREVK